MSDEKQRGISGEDFLNNLEKNMPEVVAEVRRRKSERTEEETQEFVKKHLRPSDS